MGMAVGAPRRRGEGLRERGRGAGPEGGFRVDGEGNCRT